MKLKQSRLHFCWLALAGAIASEALWAIPGVGLFASTELLHGGARWALFILFGALLLLSPFASISGRRSQRKIAMDAILFGLTIAFLARVLFDTQLPERNDALWILLFSVLSFLAFGRVIAQLVIRFFLRFFSPQKIASFVSGFYAIPGGHGAGYQAGLFIGRAIKPIQGRPAALTVQILRRCQKATDLASRRLLGRIRKGKGNGAALNKSCRTLLDAWRAEARVVRCFASFFEDEYLSGTPWLPRFDEVWCCLLEAEWQWKEDLDGSFSAQALETLIDEVADVRAEAVPAWCSQKFMQKGRVVSGEEWRELNQAVRQNKNSGGSSSIPGFWQSIVAEKFLRNGFPAWALGCLEEFDEDHWLRSRNILRHRALTCLGTGLSVGISEGDSSALEHEAIRFGKTSSAKISPKKSRQWGSRRGGKSKLPIWDFGAGSGVVMALACLTAVVLVWTWSGTNVMGDPWPVFRDIHRALDYQESPLTTATKGDSSDSILIGDADGRVHELSTRNFRMRTDVGLTEHSLPITQLAASDDGGNAFALVGDSDIQGLFARRGGRGWDAILPMDSIPWFDEESILDVELMNVEWLFATKKGVVRYDVPSRSLKGFKFDEIADADKARWQGAGKLLILRSGHLEELVMREDEAPLLSRLSNPGTNPVVDIADGGWVLCESGEAFLRKDNQWERIMGGAQFPGRRVFEDGWTQASVAAGILWSVLPEDGSSNWIVSSRSLNENFWTQTEVGDLALQPPPMIHPDGNSIRIALNGGGFLDVSLTGSGLESSFSETKDKILSWDSSSNHYLILGVDPLGVKRLRIFDWATAEDIMPNVRGLLRLQATIVTESDWAAVTVGPTSQDAFFINHSGEAYLYDFQFGGATGLRRRIIGEGRNCTGATFLAAKSAFIALSEDGSIWKTVFPNGSPEILYGARKKPDLSSGIRFVFQWVEGLDVWTTEGSQWHFNTQAGWKAIQTPVEAVQLPVVAGSRWFILGKGGSVYERVQEGWDLVEVLNFKIDRLLASNQSLLVRDMDGSWVRYEPSEMRIIPVLAGRPVGRDRPMMPLEEIVGIDDWGLLIADQAGVLSYEYETRKWRRLATVDTIDKNQDLDWMASTDSSGSALFFCEAAHTFFLVDYSSGLPQIALTETNVEQVGLGGNGEVAFVKLDGSASVQQGTIRGSISPPANDLSLDSYSGAVVCQGQPVLLSAGRVFSRKKTGFPYSEVLGPWGASNAVSLAAEGAALAVLDEFGNLWVAWDSMGFEEVPFEGVTGVVLDQGAVIFSNAAGAVFSQSEGKSMRLLAGGKGDFSFNDVRAVIANKSNIFLLTDEGVLFRDPRKRRLQGSRSNTGDHELKEVQEVSGRSFAVGGGHASELLWRTGGTRVLPFDQKGVIDLFPGGNGDVLALLSGANKISSFSSAGDMKPLWPQQQLSQLGSIRYALKVDSGALLFDGSGRVAIYRALDHAVIDLGSLQGKPQGVYQQGEIVFALTVVGTGDVRMNRILVQGEKMTVERTGPPTISAMRIHDGSLYAVGDDYSCWTWNRRGEEQLLRAAPVAERTDEEIQGVLASRGDIHLLTSEGKHFEYAPASGKSRFISDNVLRLLLHDGQVVEEVDSGLQVGNRVFKADTVRGNGKVVAYQKGLKVGLLGSTTIPVSFSSATYPGVKPVSSGNSSSGNLVVMDENGDLFSYSARLAKWNSSGVTAGQGGWQSLIFLEGEPAFAWYPGQIIHLASGRRSTCVFPPVEIGDNIFFITNERRLLKGSRDGVSLVRDWADKMADTFAGGRRADLVQGTILEGTNNQLLTWDGASFRNLRLSEGRTVDFLLAGEGGTNSWIAFSDGAVALLKQLQVVAFGEPMSSPSWRFLGVHGAVAYSFDPELQEVYSLRSKIGWELEFRYGASRFQDISLQDAWLTGDGISIGFDSKQKWWLRADQSPTSTWQQVDVVTDTFKYGLRVVRIPGIPKVAFIGFSTRGTSPPRFRPRLIQGAGSYLVNIGQDGGTLQSDMGGEVYLCEKGIFLGSLGGNYVVPYDKKVAHQSIAQPPLGLSQIPFEVVSNPIQKLPSGAGVVFWDMDAGRPLSKIGIEIGTSSVGELAVRTADGRWSSHIPHPLEIDADEVKLPFSPTPWVEGFGPFSIGNSGRYSYEDEGVKITLGTLKPSLSFDSDFVLSYAPIGDGGSILIEDRNSRLWIWRDGSRRPLSIIPSEPSGGRFSFSSRGLPLINSNGSIYAVNPLGVALSNQQGGSIQFEQDSSGSMSFLSWEKAKGEPFNFLAKDSSGMVRTTDFYGLGFGFDLPITLGVTDKEDPVWLCLNGVGRELVSGRLSVGRDLPEEKEALQVNLQSGGFTRPTPNEFFSFFLNQPKTEGKLLFERSSSGQFKVDQPVRADGDGESLVLLVDQGSSGALVIQGLGQRNGERVALRLPENNGVAGLIPHIGEEGIWLKSEGRCWFLMEEDWIERPVDQFPRAHQPASFLEVSGDKGIWSFDSGSDRFQLGSNTILLNSGRGAFSCDDLADRVSENTVTNAAGNTLIRGKDGWRVSPTAGMDFPILWGEPVEDPDAFVGVPAAGWTLEKHPPLNRRPLIQMTDSGDSIPFSVRGGKLPFERFRGLYPMNSQVLGITGVGTRILSKGISSPRLQLIRGASEFKWRPQTSWPILAHASTGAFLLFNESEWQNAPVGTRNSWLEWNRLHLGNTAGLQWQREGETGLVLSQPQTGIKVGLTEAGFLADQVDFLAADEGLFQIDKSGQVWESSSLKGGINVLVPYEKSESPRTVEQIRFPDGELGYLVVSEGQHAAISMSAIRRRIERNEIPALRSSVGFQDTAAPGFVSATMGVSPVEIRWKNPSGIVRNLSLTAEGFDFENVLSVAGLIGHGFVGGFHGGVLSRSNTGALLDVLPIRAGDSPGVVYESSGKVLLRFNDEEHELTWDGELELDNRHAAPPGSPLFERSIWQLERSFTEESEPFRLASTVKGIDEGDLQSCAIVKGALGVHSTDSAWFSASQRIITTSKRGIALATPGERGGLQEERFSERPILMAGQPARSLTSEVALRLDTSDQDAWWTFSEKRGWQIEDPTRFQVLLEGVSLDNLWRWKGDGFAGDFTLEYQVRSDGEQLGFKQVVDLEGGLDVDWCAGITTFEGEPLLVSKSALLQVTESNPREAPLALPFPLNGRVKMGSVGDGLSVVPSNSEERASAMFVVRNDGRLTIRPASEEQIENLGVVLYDSPVGRIWRTSVGLNFERRGSLLPQSPLRPDSILRGGKFTFDRPLAIRAVGDTVSVLTESSLELLALDTMELSLVASWEDATKMRDIAIDGRTVFVNQAAGAGLEIDLDSFESKPWNGQSPVQKQAVLLDGGELEVSSKKLSIENEPIEIPDGSLFTTWSQGRLWGVYPDGLRFLSTQDRWLKKVTKLE